MKIQLHLTKAQYRKMASGKGFQLPHKDMVHNSRACHRGIVQVSDKVGIQLATELNSGKHHTFRKGQIQGSGLWDAVTGTISSIGDQVKTGLQTAGKEIDAAGRKGITWIEEHAGDIAEQIKENVPEEYVQKVQKRLYLQVVQLSDVLN